MHSSAIKVVALLVTISLISTTLAESELIWNYNRADSSYGPSAWASNFEQCGLDRNSPINIVRNDAVRQKVEPWILQGWNSDNAWSIEDTGYTVKYSLKTDKSISTSGGNLGTYDMVQFHFHWGRDNTVGSEHKFNGRSFPMEVHFVHRNSKFSTTTAAVESGEDDALAVLGFFFQLQARDNPNLGRLIDGVIRVRAEADLNVDTYTLNPLEDWTHAAMRGNFYRYDGGLTTPGCQQIVKWTVFERPIGISAAQMQMFRNTKPSSFGVDFFRDPQRIGSRVVTLYDVRCRTNTCRSSRTPARFSRRNHRRSRPYKYSKRFRGFRYSRYG